MNDNILTNCPKCGNPLVPGTKSCPVCGTSLDAQAAASNMPGVAVNQPSSVSPVQMPSVQPSAPQSVQNGGVGDFAPSIQTTQQPTAIPSVSSNSVPGVSNSSIPTLTPGVVQSETTTKNKPKLKLNNKTLIIILVVIVVVALAFVLLKGSGKNTKKVINTTPVVEEVETKDVVANGYSFKVEQDWKVQSNNDNTVVTNNNENVIIKLENYSFNLSSLSKDMLASRFVDISNDFNPNKVLVNNVDITETKIASKDAYIVNAIVTEDDGKKYATQYYFISGGSDLVVGASVVYTNDEAKTNYEGKVTTLLNNLSFVNDSTSIISMINKNSKAFSVYFSAINGVTLNIPEENPEVPIEGEQNQGEDIGGVVVDNQVVDNPVVDNPVGDEQFEEPGEENIG